MQTLMHKSFQNFKYKNAGFCKKSDKNGDQDRDIQIYYCVTPLENILSIKEEEIYAIYYINVKLATGLCN